MKTAAFHTLGCKVNQYDTQAMLEKFRAAGYEIVPFDADADVYVINTCTVTGTGDKKSMQIIRRCHRQNPQAQIVVTGCLAQRAADELTLPGVRLVLGTQRRGEIVELLEQAMKQDCALVAVETLRKAPFEHLTVHAHEGHTRATMKIQEGCDRWCTYCIIPSVRGPIRSRPVDEIAAEARSLAEAGFREVVLTGIHLTSYGRDAKDGTTLLDAIRAAHDVPGIARVRLGSLEPVVVTPEFVEGIKGMPKVCHQFHNVAGRPVLTGFLIVGLVEAAHKLLEDGAHSMVVQTGEIAARLRAEVNVLADKLLDDRAENVGFDHGVDLVSELELVQNFLHVRRKAVEICFKIRLELLRGWAAGQVAQAEGRSVAESLPSCIA